MNSVRGLTRKRNWLPALLLVVVFAFAFLIRTFAYQLPGIQARERSFYLDEAGEPYLSEMDSYFYFRKATEMAEENRVITEVNRDEDPLMGSAEVLVSEEDTLPLGISVLAFLIWKILSPFGVTLTQVVIWMAPVLGSLGVFPAFFYVRRRTNWLGGLVAALLTGCALPYLYHTHAGFFDTDMVLAFLPLVLILSMMRAMGEMNRKKQVLFALLSVVSAVALGFCWQVYYAYLILAVAGGLLTLLAIWVFRILRRDKAGRQQGRTARRGFLLCVGCASALLLVSFGTKPFHQIASAAGAMQSTVGGGDAMPYTFQFTMEMQPLAFFPTGSPLNFIKANSDSILGRMGGAFPFLLALLFLPLGGGLALRRNKSSPEKAAHSCVPCLSELCFLGLWMAGGLYLTIHTGRRFAEIAVMPVCLLCGLTVGRLWQQSKKVEWSWKRILCMVLCTGVACCAVLPAGYGAWKAGHSTSLFVTDARAEALSWIRENTPKETAIAAWWDDGYFTEYQSRRRTILDGGSDSARMNWMMAQALLTDDPAVMARILRMLDHGGASALDSMQAAGMTEAEAALLLREMMGLDREEALRMLSERGLSEEIGDWTHPASHAPLLLTTSTDLLSKCRALSYYAWWNPGQGASEETASCVVSSTSMELDQDGRAEIPMRQERYRVILQASEDGELQVTLMDNGTERIPPRWTLWREGKKIREISLSDGAASDQDAIQPWGLVILQEGDRYSAILCTENIMDSMLIRLLACQDQEIAEVSLLGVWAGDASREESATQRRIDPSRRVSWATQVWQISDLPTGMEAGESSP